MNTNMTDLFANIEAEVVEAVEERAAILEFDGGLPRAEAERQAWSWSEEFRHECEVRHVVELYREKGSPHVTALLEKIEKARGPVAMQKLRGDALALLARQGMKRA